MFKSIIKKKEDCRLTITQSISIVQSFTKTTPFSWCTDIFIPVLISFLTGFLIWIITIKTSNAKQRHSLRRTLNAIYNRFRLDIVRTFLEAEGAYLDWNEIKELCKPENFRKRYNPASHNYGAVQNRMDDSDMRKKMSKMFNDFGFAIQQSVIITDVISESTATKLLAVANDLSNQAFEFEHTGKIDNPVDYAYGIIAQWNCMTGNVNNDFIRDRINKI